MTQQVQQRKKKTLSTCKFPSGELFEIIILSWIKKKKSIRFISMGTRQYHCARTWKQDFLKWSKRIEKKYFFFIFCKPFCVFNQFKSYECTEYLWIFFLFHLIFSLLFNNFYFIFFIWYIYAVHSSLLSTYLSFFFFISIP